MTAYDPGCPKGGKENLAQTVQVNFWLIEFNGSNVTPSSTIVIHANRLVQKTNKQQKQQQTTQKTKNLQENMVTLIK